jgi:hypothetical protein
MNPRCSHDNNALEQAQASVGPPACSQRAPCTIATSTDAVDNKHTSASAQLGTSAGTVKPPAAISRGRRALAA